MLFEREKRFSFYSTYVRPKQKLKSLKSLKHVPGVGLEPARTLLVTK